MRGFWADMKSSDFKNITPDAVAILPIGAIEQHGPHLPVSVDRDLVDAVALRVMDHIEPDQNVLILPTMAIGKSNEHNGHAGTLSYSAETLMRMLTDVARSLHQSGIKRLVFLNGHGGNSALLDVVARDLHVAFDMHVAACSWFQFADYSAIYKADEIQFDLHGGDIETSAMLSVAPHLVDMRLALNFVPKIAHWNDQFTHIGIGPNRVLPSWIIDDITESGACGNAANATADKGVHLMTTAAKNFAVFLREFSIFDPTGDA